MAAFPIQEQVLIPKKQRKASTSREITATPSVFPLVRRVCSPPCSRGDQAASIQNVFIAALSERDEERSSVNILSEQEWLLEVFQVTYCFVHLLR